MDKKRNAFTLAETLIVLVVLGIIATLAVPNLINKQKETTQKTKVKKAMTIYESAVNRMIIENNRSFTELNEAGCGKTISHFKYIKRDSNNGCIFQTSDKIWWNITDIQRPIIAFERDDLTTDIANNADNNKAFVFVGRFDDMGILRVDDLVYEIKKPLNNSDEQLAKLYKYLYNIKTDIVYDFNRLREHLKNREYDKECENPQMDYSFDGAGYCMNCKGCTFYYNGEYRVYDKNGEWIMAKHNCRNGSYNCSDTTVWDRKSDHSNNGAMSNCNDFGTNCRNCNNIDQEDFCTQNPKNF